MRQNYYSRYNRRGMLNEGAYTDHPAIVNLEEETNQQMARATAIFLAYIKKLGNAAKQELVMDTVYSIFKEEGRDTAVKAFTKDVKRGTVPSGTPAEQPMDGQESYYRYGSRLSESRQRDYNRRRYYY